MAVRRKARVRPRIAVTASELSTNQRAASGKVNTEVKAASAMTKRAQGGTSTDRLKGRVAGPASEVQRGKAVVAGAQTVGKRFDAQQARRTPGRNSTGRLVGGFRGGISAPTGGVRKLGRKPFDL